MLVPSPTLGALLRSLRDRQGWTLKQMSAKCGIPVSTLSKVEHDRLTLSYDKLYQISQRLGLRMSELFAEPSDDVKFSDVLHVSSPDCVRRNVLTDIEGPRAARPQAKRRGRQ